MVLGLVDPTVQGQKTNAKEWTWTVRTYTASVWDDMNEASFYNSRVLTTTSTNELRCFPHGDWASTKILRYYSLLSNTTITDCCCFFYQAIKLASLQLTVNEYEEVRAMTMTNSITRDDFMPTA